MLRTAAAAGSCFYWPVMWLLLESGSPRSVFWKPDAAAAKAGLHPYIMASARRICPGSSYIGIITSYVNVCVIEGMKAYAYAYDKERRYGS